MVKCRMIYLLRRFDFEARSWIHGTSRGASRTDQPPGFLVAHFYVCIILRPQRMEMVYFLR